MTAYKIFLLCVFFLLPAKAHAVPWTIDQSKSQIGFEGVQTGNAFSGRFERFTVTVDYDPAKPEAASLEVNIDLSSAKTGDVQRDAALPQPDWFDAKNFSIATFVADGFEHLDQNQFQTTGILQLKAIEQSLTVPFTLVIQGDTASAKGSFSLNRSDFGVGVGPWAEGKWVALKVEVNFEIFAHLEKAGG